MKKAMLIAVLAIPVLATGAAALDGADGSTVTRLFDQEDAFGEMIYPAGFGGLEWGELAGSTRLGTDTWNLEVPVVAVNADGVVYFRISGGNLDGNAYTGVASWDGSRFAHLVQDVLFNAGYPAAEVGSRVDALTVSPVTAGRLVAGRPVVARYVVNASGGFGTELSSLNDGVSPPEETTVLTIDAARVDRVAIDGEGAILCMLPDASVVRFEWNGTGYAGLVLATDVGLALAVGPDGDAYTFPADTRWGRTGSREKNDLLRIDRDTGAKTVYASVSERHFFGGMAFDGAGRLWMGLADLRKKTSAGVLTEVEAGVEVGSGRTIAVSPHYARLRGFGAAPDGDVYVLERQGPSDADPVAMFRVTPGTDSGGGGGGKGGGKGRK